MMRSSRLVAGALLVAACSGGTPEATLGDGDPGGSAEAATTITTPAIDEPDERSEERLDMVADQIEGRGVSDPLVLRAMRAVPRHRFVPDDYRNLAYADQPLPIGHGQTISQPHIVAVMTQALEVASGDRVLEIGTGSGYQAAVLAEMGVTVFTIEIIEELADQAAARLDGLGYERVSVRWDDGYWGWEEEAPFDAIIVTAAPDHVPQPLLDQLATGATLVIPVGPPGAVQTLWRFTLDPATDEVLAESMGAVRFVPFTRSE